MEEGMSRSGGQGSGLVWDKGHFMKARLGKASCCWWAGGSLEMCQV